MIEFLNAPDSSFYHLTIVSKLEGIKKNGLKAFNQKGISVIRTHDIRIVNSLIVTQLNSPAVQLENNFVLLKIPQSLNNFTPNEIRPDIVLEWTTPLHNNIINRVIPFEKLEIYCRFCISDWDRLNNDDFKNENEIRQALLYSDALNLKYLVGGKLNTFSELVEIQNNLYAFDS